MKTTKKASEKKKIAKKAEKNVKAMNVPTTSVKVCLKEDTDRHLPVLAAKKAVEGLKDCLKALRKEALSLRSLIRVICDNATSAKIAPLALYFDLDASANKARREIAYREMLALIPFYYTERMPDGTIIEHPAQLNKVAEGIYKCVAMNDAIKQIEAICENTSRKHTRLTCGTFYDNEGCEIEQKTAKAKAASNKASEKQIKDMERKRKALEVLGLQDITSVGDIYDLLVLAYNKAKDNALKDVIRKAIDQAAKCNE